jgi:putative flippase GtrA
MSLVRKVLRYAAVSAIATALSLTILGVLVATGATTPGWANLIATGVGTVPSFELNRRWVWGKRGSRSLAAEIGPFCALSFAGLALSTIAVSEASRWATGDGLGVGARTLVAELANVATFGTLWVVQFVILDRVLFRARTREAPSVESLPLEDEERMDLRAA